jgi:hypothetical protein
VIFPQVLPLKAGYRCFAGDDVLSGRYRGYPWLR